MNEQSGSGKNTSVNAAGPGHGPVIMLAAAGGGVVGGLLGALIGVLIFCLRHCACGQ